jgi:hypothetical protein
MPLHHYRFRLVQRLKSLRAPDDHMWGLEKYFAIPYMNSPLFGDEAISRALTRMRSSPDLTIGKVTLARGTVARTVYFVGSKASMASKIVDFRAWFLDDVPSTERACYFEENFARPDNPRKPPTTDAWWSLEDDLAFALDERVAYLLIKAFVRG